MFEIRLSKLFYVPESLATAFSRISWASFTLNLKQSLLSKASAILHNCQRVPEIDRNIPSSSVDYCFFSISRNDFLLFIATYHRWPIPSTGQSQCVPPFRSVPFRKLLRLYAGGVKNCLNSNYTKYLAQLCSRFFAFLKIPAAIFRILWRHLPTELRNV